MTDWQIALAELQLSIGQLGEAVRAVGPTARALSRDVAELLSKQSAWCRCHNAYRAFGTTLSWLYWSDFHGGAMLRYRIDGHDVEAVLSEKRLQKILSKEALGEALSPVDLGVQTLAIESVFVQCTPLGFMDAVPVRVEGHAQQAGFSFNFESSFLLLYFPDQASGNRFTLAAQLKLAVSGRLAMDVSLLRRKMQSAVLRAVRRVPIPSLPRIAGLTWVSAHLNGGLASYGIFAVPRRPVRALRGAAVARGASAKWDLILKIDDDIIPDRIPGRIGWLGYRSAPSGQGDKVLLFVVRIDVNLGGTVDLGWLGSFSWRYEAIHWPAFWLRLRTQVDPDTSLLKVFATVTREGSAVVEREEELLRLPDVAIAELRTDPGKGFEVGITLKETRN